MIICEKCFSQDIDELLWVDVVSGEISDRMYEYYCRSCDCQTEIIDSPDEDLKEDLNDD